jgi:hypothetical protein
MLQTSYEYMNSAFTVGQLIKPQEPNDLESLPIANDIKVGRFVKLDVDENGIEMVDNLVSTDTVEAIFGISINDVKNSKTFENSFFYNKEDNAVALIGRVGSKLSIYPFFILQDELAKSDYLTAPLYAIAGGDNSGALYIGTPPTPPTGVAYLALPTNYKLRVNAPTGEIYLEIGTELTIMSA